MKRIQAGPLSNSFIPFLEWGLSLLSSSRQRQRGVGRYAGRTHANAESGIVETHPEGRAPYQGSVHEWSGPAFRPESPKAHGLCVDRPFPLAK